MNKLFYFPEDAEIMKITNYGNEIEHVKKGTIGQEITPASFKLVKHLSDDIQDEIVRFDLSRNRFRKRLLLINAEAYITGEEDVEYVKISQ